jgi:hypothetical protein
VRFAVVALGAVLVLAGCGPAEVASPLPRFERADAPGWSIDIPVGATVHDPPSAVHAVWVLGEATETRPPDAVIMLDVAPRREVSVDQLAVAIPKRYPGGMRGDRRLSAGDVAMRHLTVLRDDTFLTEILVFESGDRVIALHGTGLPFEQLVAMAVSFEDTTS